MLKAPNTTEPLSVTDISRDPIRVYTVFFSVTSKKIETPSPSVSYFIPDLNKKSRDFKDPKLDYLQTFLIFIPLPNFVVLDTRVSTG